MKGILKHTTAGWYVWYNIKKDEITSGYDSIPLHPSEKVDDSFRDKEVEFKIIYYLETGIEEPFKVAELVKAYPELEGTMNLCEDIVEKKTGKMTEEEWQAAERAQTEPKQETVEEADSKWSLEEAQKFALSKFKKENSPGVVTWKSVLDVLTVGVLTGHKFGAKWQEERTYSEEEVIDFLQEMNDWPTTFEGRIDIREWFEQFKKK